MCVRFSFRTADTLESRPRKKRRAGSPLLVPPLGAGSALKRVVVAKVSVLPNWQPSAILTETAFSAFADFVCKDNTLRQQLSIIAWKDCRKCDGRPAGVRFNLQNLIGIDYPTLAAGIGNGKTHARRRGEIDVGLQFDIRKHRRDRRRVCLSRDEARQDVFDCIEMFYNPKRKHVRKLDAVARPV